MSGSFATAAEIQPQTQPSPEQHETNVPLTVDSAGTSRVINPLRIQEEIEVV